MNEKPFTADEVFNACALIIERKIFRNWFKQDAYVGDIISYFICIYMDDR